VRKDIKTDSFRPVLKVTMGHKPTIDRLFELFGAGSVQTHKAKSKAVNSSWSWLCQCDQVWKPLEKMFPYLLTKREEADLLFRFRDLPSGAVGGAGGNPQQTAEMVDAKAVFYWRLRMLKPRWRFYAAALKPGELAEMRRLGLETV